MASVFPARLPFEPGKCWDCVSASRDANHADEFPRDRSRLAHPETDRATDFRDFLLQRTSESSVSAWSSSPSMEVENVDGSRE